MAVPAPPAEDDREECLRLLSGAAVGRVVFTASAMPAAQPVAFVVDDGEIVFRASGPIGAARKDVRLARLTGLPLTVLGTASAQSTVIAIRLHQLSGQHVRPAGPR